MKHINIIKKAAGTISIFLLILSLTACGNAISENASSLSGVEGAAKNTEGISLKGQIKLQGAAPARSATSSFSDNITWVINAVSSDYSADHDQLISGAQASALTSENTFSMKIPKEGTYAFTVLGYPGNYSTIEQVASKTPLFQGYKTGVEITETGLRTALEITVAPLLTGTAPQNADSPVAETSDYGTINLLINDISESISKLSATLTAYQREMDPIIKETTFDGGETTLYIENVPAGKYTAKLDFEDSNGNILYSCNEAINVYNGMTTDTWYGTAPYLVNGKFTLTGSLIDLYGAEVVPDTQTVLYDYDSETRWSYSFANSDSLLDNAYNQADFCFDSNGNVYLGTNTDVMQFYYYDVSKKQVYQIQTEQISSSGFLDYDFAKNQLWFVTDGKFYKFSQLSENSSESPITYSADVTVYNFRTTDSGAGSLLSACIYNDKAYLVYSTVDNQAVPFVMLEYDISSAEVDEEVPTQFYIASPKATKELCAGMGLSSYATITDMLYQDGAVYILVRDSKAETNEIYSQGGIIKYDVILGTISQVGFVPGTNLSSFIAATKTEQYPLLYKSEDATDYYLTEFTLAEGSYYRIYAPYNSQESFFVGPQKFIAIKPKKLVISDTGLAFYTTENGVLAKKKINRVVEIDLETLSMENVKMTDVAVEFNAEYPVPSMSGIEVTKQLYSGNAYREFEGSFYEVTGLITLKPVIIEE